MTQRLKHDGLRSGITLVFEYGTCCIDDLTIIFASCFRCYVADCCRYSYNMRSVPFTYEDCFSACVIASPSPRIKLVDMMCRNRELRTVIRIFLIAEVYMCNISGNAIRFAAFFFDDFHADLGIDSLSAAVFKHQNQGST